MEKFIKENWFKLGILFILLISSFSFVYYFIDFLPQKQNQSQILQCNLDGGKLYKDQYELIAPQLSTSPEFKYVKKSHKCYLVVSSDSIKDFSHEEYIVDVYENKMIVSSLWFTTTKPEQIFDSTSVLYGVKNYLEAKKKLLDL